MDIVEDIKGYSEIQVSSIRGRYLPPDLIVPFLEGHDNFVRRQQIGVSVLGAPIDEVVIGSGPVTILMWSQMHGNESTTTKAVLDLINALALGYDKATGLLQQLTLVVIPMLNPDGARAYTRENANGVDLNRDARQRTQPESRALREVYQRHTPDFCFNLHDQRTIFSAGSGPHPATLSFLSPAADPSRRMTRSRQEAMKVISAINSELQKYIPAQVGRYDDAFNPNCVGDAFQMLETPTILFEAGHFQEDYEREQTRKFVFMALWTALESIASQAYQKDTKEGYLSIPENEKKFFDFLIRNAQKISGKPVGIYDTGILLKEELASGAVRFTPRIEKEGSLGECYGHQTFDCSRPEDLEALHTRTEIMELFLGKKR